ncbi:MAG: hypothetical protein JO152_12365 [Mycobacteriaceae bacterium]|nr:hypothetical protein [Mycobacteriaceae bacterium]
MVLGESGERVAAVGGAVGEHRVTGMSGQDHRARAVGRIGAVAGVAAVLAAIAVGTTMLIDAPASKPKTTPTAEHITVSAQPTLPLSAAQIADLVHQRPDFGALADPARRASCLNGLGYPASTQILGARPVELAERPAVLLVLAGDTPDALVALAVQPNCSSADTGLIATTRIDRP